MGDVFKINHNGVDITYNEAEDKWEFELRGRNRSAESLTKAKEAIDKPVPAKEEPFNRFDAYLTDRWLQDGFKLVTVTSIAEPARYSHESDTVWVVDKEGNRSKEGVHTLYAVCDMNKGLIRRRLELKNQISKLEEEAQAIVKGMKHIKIPKNGDQSGT